MASFFRGLSATLLLGGGTLLTALSFGLAGCGDDPAPGAPVCSGVKNADGKCIAKCVEKRDCTGNQVCSTVRLPEGTCEAPCGADKECAVGSACVDGANMAGAAIKVCQTREQLDLKPNGFGVACTQPGDCDVAHGLTCDAGKCGLPLGGVCKAATECLSGACDAGKCRPRFLEAAAPCEGNGECKSGVCDANKCAVSCLNLAGCPSGTTCQGLETGKGVCRSAPGLTAGQYSQACPKGNECDKAAGFTCIGLVGDVDAFCSKVGGCAKDDECPTGYWCGGVRDAEGEEGKIPGSQRTCVKRSFCAPCDTDVDCGFTFGARCVPDANGTKFCTTSCAADKRSCRFGAECVDTGGGDFNCRPDSGSCAAPTPSEAKSCDACRNDLDCGPGGYCLGSVVQGAINKPSVRWCVTPCGPADADGKRTCPKGTNGLEMVCLDENNLDLATRELGVSTGEGKDATIPVLPGYCYPAPTFDNEVSYDNDPPKNVCGNGLRDPGEECDDANKSTSDGCVDCKISEKCRFSITTDNSDEDPSLTASDGSVVASVPTSCKSFIVEGSLEKGGDVDVIDYEMGTNLTTSLAEVFTGDLGTCNADLVLEVRDGQKPDVTSPCSALFPPTLRFASLLQCKNNIGCGSCDEGSNLCGFCDDDSGIGNCPRALLDRVTSYGGDKVVNASAHKWMRIRARDTALTVPSYKLVVTGLKGDTSNPGSLVNRPELTCW